MTKMYMEGAVFPIGLLNKNGWGLADEPSVIKSTIETLKTSKIRICPITDDSEHSCDFNNDDTSNIGNIINAWRENDDIKVKLVITDENAVKKFNSNEFGTTWSPYGFAQTIDDDGFIRDNYINKSLTFVSNPAWNKTYGTIVAASEEKPVFEKDKLHSFIELQASEIFGETMPDEDIIDETEQTEQTEQTDVTVNETLVKLEELYNTEKSRNDELATKLEVFMQEFKKEPDQSEPANEGTVPEAIVTEMVNVAIAKERESVQKENAIKTYQDTCKNIGVEIKPEDIERFSSDGIKANDINKELELITKIYSKYNKTPIGVTNEPTYSVNEKKETKTPTDFQNATGWTVGTPDMWKEK